VLEGATRIAEPGAEKGSEKKERGKRFEELTSNNLKTARIAARKQHVLENYLEYRGNRDHPRQYTQFPSPAMGGAQKTTRGLGQQPGKRVG